MMCDIKKRANFARLVNYANNPKKAKLIDSNATLTVSMQWQADGKPGRKLANPVYHISLNFAREDGVRLTDGVMTEIAQGYMWRIPTDSEQSRQRFAELAQSGRLVAPRFGNGRAVTDTSQSASTYNNGGNSHILGGNNSVIGDGGNGTMGTADTASTIGNIIQITVATFIELAVQPHQIRIFSGCGGGSDRGGWNDKEKNGYKPRCRR